MKTTEKKTPKKSPRVKVSLRPEEQVLIKQQADQAGLAVSAYLRKVGLGYPINSALDYQAVDTLAKINADLGRLGGLLKMWLTNDERLKSFEPVQLRETLVGVVEQLNERQNELRTCIKRVVRQ
jgi:hypothetical protein